MQCRRLDVIVALISDWSFQTNQFLLLDFFSRILMMAFVLYIYFLIPCSNFSFDYCLYALYLQEADMQSLEKHVNFENENSRKAYYREFKKVRSRSDMSKLGEDSKMG